MILPLPTSLDYVDLFLVHDPTKHDVPTIWKEMEQVRAKGLTKSIGVSNFHVENLKKVLDMASVPPVMNQVCLYALGANVAYYRFSPFRLNTIHTPSKIRNRSWICANNITFSLHPTADYHL